MLKETSQRGKTPTNESSSASWECRAPNWYPRYRSLIKRRAMLKIQVAAGEIPCSRGNLDRPKFIEQIRRIFKALKPCNAVMNIIPKNASYRLLNLSLSGPWSGTLKKKSTSRRIAGCRITSDAKVRKWSLNPAYWISLLSLNIRHINKIQVPFSTNHFATKHPSLWQ